VTAATNLLGFARVDSFTDVPEHVGVWLDRCYLPESAKDKPRRAELYRRAIDALSMGKPAVETYRSFFERWKQQMESGDVPRRIVEIQATSRVLLHPSSNGSITDGSILLHHTYGVPYLPGSGLKGITRAWMRQTVGVAERQTRQTQLAEAWDNMRSDARDQDLVRALFGSIPRQTDGDEARAEAGAVEFLDALWIPEKPTGANGDWSPLALDVINPHQSAYYTGDKPPADTNEPIPTHRLTVSPGTRFCVVVEGVRANQDVTPWVDFAVDQLLGPALASMGFGAWTNAGYGRFEMKGAASQSKVATPGKTIGTAEEWVTAVVELNPGSGALKAKIPLGRTAEARNPIAQELRNALPDELRERLTKKRSLSLQVRIEPVGNAWQIVGLKPV
jgi:CRISPR-associated protein Cmr6